VNFVTWRLGAMTLGICAAALAWQNARLRDRLGDGRAGEGAADVRLVSAGGSHDEGAGQARQTTGSLGRGDGEGAVQESSADPPPPRRHWAVELLRPREGEDLLAYRDRVLPIAQAVVAPQRLRVGERRRRMTASARLDAGQNEELDAAVSDASDEIVNRVWQALATDEIWPRPRPSAGVALAADLLRSVTAAETRFRAVLRDDQRAAVDQSGFDFVDYLVFSVPWEERFGITAGAMP
jgi:hypothetical protein